MKAALALLVLVAACGTDAVDSPDKLQDPTTCKQCHPTHFSQWQESMHAYASVDPVFVAMNKRGQRATGGQLGTFCVQCHAPMAVALGTTDGTNYDPATLTPQTNGITCYFCHDVNKIADDHNNGLSIALDSTMHGGLEGPVGTTAHDSVYDPVYDGDTNDSSMCGSCHDIVNGHQVAIERTFAEWKSTFFTESDPLHHLTCGGCHMRSTSDHVADPSLGTPPRPNGFHLHVWPGIDQSVTPGFPGASDMAMQISGDLDPAIGVVGATPISGPPAPGGICVDQKDGISVRIDSIGVGHAWPSGASQDRRAWLELTAKDASGAVVFQTGVVPDGMDPDDIGDPNLVEFGDHMLKDDGTTPAHFFWEAASIAPMCNPRLTGASNTANNRVCLLQPPTTLNQNVSAFDHSSTAIFQIGDISTIQHIDAQLHIRPYDLATINDLISSGDLDASILATLPTLDILGTKRSWDKATEGMGPAMGTGCAIQVIKLPQHASVSNTTVSPNWSIRTPLRDAGERHARDRVAVRQRPHRHRRARRSAARTR